jgi:hypothetical protein
MAFSPTDPMFEHSLGLQLRATRRKPRRSQWRGDWTPIWIVLLIVSILAVFSQFFPPIDSLERAEQATQSGSSEQRPVFGVLVAP